MSSDFGYVSELSKNHGEAVYIIHFREMVYHQRKALYIVEACGSDKKTTGHSLSFFGGNEGARTLDLTDVNRAL